jgi:hypothetical protein
MDLEEDSSSSLWKQDLTVRIYPTEKRKKTPDRGREWAEVWMHQRPWCDGRTMRNLDSGWIMDRKRC